MSRVSNKARKILEEGKLVGELDGEIYGGSNWIKFWFEYKGKEYKYTYFLNSVYRSDIDELQNESSYYTFKADSDKLREIFLKRDDVRSIIVKYLLIKKGWR